ncbi:MAG: prepilin peptidase [Pirellulales bacterium]
MSSKQRNVWLRRAVVIVTMVSLTVLIGWPVLEYLLQSAIHDDPTLAADRLQWLEQIRFRLINTFGYVWFFFVGATIGSFMNVVVWRMPRGKSVVSTPSSCPFCCTKIKSFDNVPVLGWIMLGGKCRACRLPISSRYPIVEALVGTVFVLLLQVELLSGGANLPGIEATLNQGFSRVLFELNWNIIGPYAYHCMLFCLLIVWMLIAYDRQRIPIKSIAFAVILGSVLPLVWPSLMVVSWDSSNWEGFADPARINLAVSLIIGGIIGGVLGLLIRSVKVTPSDSSSSERNLTQGWETFAILISVGIFLGWQAALTIAAISTAVEAAIALAYKIKQAHNNSATAGFVLMAITLIYVCSWKAFDSSNYWPGNTFIVESLYLPLALLVLSLIGLRMGSTRQEIDMTRFAKISDRKTTE